MSTEMERERESKDGLNFGVEGDVGSRNPVDREFLTVGFRELEKSADVIILVVTGEEALRLGGGKAEGGKSHGLAKITGERTIMIY